jgi:hypothetical protein
MLGYSGRAIFVFGMELVVKILEDIFDVPGRSLDVLVKFTAFFDKFYRSVGQSEQC